MLAQGPKVFERAVSVKLLLVTPFYFVRPSARMPLNNRTLAVIGTPKVAASNTPVTVAAGRYGVRQPTSRACGWFVAHSGADRQPDPTFSPSPTTVLRFYLEFPIDLTPSNADPGASSRCDYIGGIVTRVSALPRRGVRCKPLPIHPPLTKVPGRLGSGSGDCVRFPRFTSTTDLILFVIS